MKKRYLTPEQREEILDKYVNKKFTVDSLAKEYEKSFVSIYNLLRKNNIKIDYSLSYRKYPINENYFDIIDCEQKAYILGLLYADGWSNPNNSTVCIGLIEDDRHMLDSITKLIQPTKPLHFRDKNKINGYDNAKNQYHLQIANRHIFNRIKELGIYPNKSSNLNFPTKDQIPEKLLRHFLRGYFDGDGCITIYSNVCSFNYICTNEFAVSLQLVLEKELNFKRVKLEPHKNKNNNMTTLRYGGVLNCLRIKEYFYKDATLFLNRKKEKFDTVEEMYSNRLRKKRYKKWEEK